MVDVQSCELDARFSALLSNFFGIVCIVGLPWLYHIKSLADATKVTKACNLLQGRHDIKAVTLPWKPEHLFAIGQERPKGIAGRRYEVSMDIFRTAW
jgi:hypothetical protein